MEIIDLTQDECHDENENILEISFAEKMEITPNSRKRNYKNVRYNSETNVYESPQSSPDAKRRHSTSAKNDFSKLNKKSPLKFSQAQKRVAELKLQSSKLKAGEKTLSKKIKHSTKTIKQHENLSNKSKPQAKTAKQCKQPPKVQSKKVRKKSNFKVDQAYLPNIQCATLEELYKPGVIKRLEKNKCINYYQLIKHSRNKELSKNDEMVFHPGDYRFHPVRPFMNMMEVVEVGDHTEYLSDSKDKMMKALGLEYSGVFSKRKSLKINRSATDQVSRKAEVNEGFGSMSVPNDVEFETINESKSNNKDVSRTKSNDRRIELLSYRL